MNGMFGGTQQLRLGNRPGGRFAASLAWRSPAVTRGQVWAAVVATLCLLCAVGGVGAAAESNRGVDGGRGSSMTGAEVTPERLQVSMVSSAAVGDAVLVSANFRLSVQTTPSWVFVAEPTTDAMTTPIVVGASVWPQPGLEAAAPELVADSSAEASRGGRLFALTERAGWEERVCPG